MKMDLKENQKVLGHLQIYARHEDGRIEKVVDQKNLVTTVGLNLLRDLISGNGSAFITHAALGSGTTAPSLTDTALENEVIRKAVAVDISIGSGKVRFEWEIGKPEANSPGTISEAGLLTALSGGILVTHITFAPFNKTDKIELSCKWTLAFLGA